MTKPSVGAASVLVLLLAGAPAGAQEVVAGGRATVHDIAGELLNAILEAGSLPGPDENMEPRPPPPVPERRPEGGHDGPSGVYATLGVGTGAGRLTLADEYFTEVDTYLDWGDFHFAEAGWQFGALRLGVGWTEWSEDEDRGPVRTSQVDLLAALVGSHGFSVKAGVGYGVVRDAPLMGGRTSYAGLSGRIGVGWEGIRLGPLRLGLESGLVGVSYNPGGEDDLTLEVSAVVLAATVGLSPAR